VGVEKEVQFEIPGSGIRTPLYCKGEPLELGLVEVGRRSSGKYGQLKMKRQLVLNIRGRNIDSSRWWPKVYKIGAFFMKMQKNCLLPGKKMGVDVVISYPDFTENMMRRLSMDEIGKLIYRMHLYPEFCNEIEKMFEYLDVDKLRDKMTRTHTRTVMPVSETIFRGVMSETFAFHDIEYACGNDIDLNRNGFVDFINRQYKRGTEIDGILTFYGIRPIQRMVNELQKMTDLDIRHHLPLDERVAL